MSGRAEKGKNHISAGLIDQQLVSAALSNRRKELGMTIPEVARIAGASMSTVHKLESGNITVQLDIVLKVLSALQTDPVAFFTAVAPDGIAPISTFATELVQHANSNTPQLLRDIADAMENKSQR